tara:strand:- start:156 stop:620 length:465 start_codon:yes stop_codon:yes gene_type:complete
MNKQQVKNYVDTPDRIIIQDWLSKKGHYLTEGGKCEVDLEGDKFDAEISHLFAFKNLWNQWQKENRFRIEIRKRNHYWDGIYNKSHTTHFFQMNSDGKELLVYPEDLIMEYAEDTEVVLDYLMKYKGFSKYESTFMCIPFEIGKHKIKRFKLND